MNRRTYTALRQRAAKEAKRGHCVIADATFGKAVQRAQFKRALAKAGARVIFLEAYAGDRRFAQGCAGAKPARMKSRTRARRTSRN
jgi:predicted kinase